MRKRLLCNSCGNVLPKGATFCAECKLYQDWRRHVPIYGTIVALCVGIIAAGTAVKGVWTYVSDYDSNTRFKVTSSDADHVYLKVWNTGHRPSTLVAYRLLFDESRENEVLLDLDTRTREAGNNVIDPGVPVKIGLTRALLTEPYSNHVEQYRAERVKHALAGKLFNDVPMTLIVDVEESSDSSGESHQERRDRFTANRIHEFIEGSIRP
jgi:hypothetical protein